MKKNSDMKNSDMEKIARLGMTAGDLPGAIGAEGIVAL